MDPKTSIEDLIKSVSLDRNNKQKKMDKNIKR